MTAKRKTPVALIVILLIGLTHGLIYLALMPPWQHYDEPTHFEYAWLVANWSRIPEPGEYDPQMRQAVAQSMIENGFYDGMGYLPDLSVPDGQVTIGGYSQLGDPPVYYVLAALPVGLLKSQPIDVQLYGARLLSVGLLLVSIAGIYGLVYELTIPGSPLRWIIPGGVVLLPGFIELMSAVNSDVGAVAFMSLVLWGIVRLVKRGWHLWTTVWSATAMVLCLFTKETAYIAAPVWLIGVFVSLLPGKWKRLGWSLIAIVGLILLLIIVGWGDAARWYRATDQAEDTRYQQGAAPVGEAVFRLRIEDPSQQGGATTQLSQLVRTDMVHELRGQPVTVGVWMWADQPVTTLLPVLTAYRADRGANQAMHTVEINTEPVFYAYHASVPENTTQLQIHLSSANMGATGQGTVYLDGLVLVAGELPLDSAPVWDSAGAEMGTWGGVTVINAIRNASAEASGPRVYPWVDHYGSRAIPNNGRPSLLIYSLTDLERTGSYYSATAQNLLQTFWGKFAWGHVRLEGKAIYSILAVVTLFGLLGCSAVVGYKFSRYQLSALGILGLTLVGVWGLTLVRGVFQTFNVNSFIPGARYAYPVIGPTMGILGYGWWSIISLIAKGLRLKSNYLMGFLILAMVGLDIWSMISIWRYYAG